MLFLSDLQCSLGLEVSELKLLIGSSTSEFFIQMFLTLAQPNYNLAVLILLPSLYPAVTSPKTQCLQSSH